MKPIPQRVGILCSSATCFSAVSASNGKCESTSGVHDFGIPETR
jgi:hypothetical protein